MPLTEREGNCLLVAKVTSAFKRTKTSNSSPNAIFHMIKEASMTIIVGDMKRSIQFYTRTLGLKLDGNDLYLSHSKWG